MPNSVSPTALTRRRFTQLSGMAAGALALSSSARPTEVPDVTLEIAPYPWKLRRSMTSRPWLQQSDSRAVLQDALRRTAVC